MLCWWVWVWVWVWACLGYRKIFNISGTESPNLNVSCLVLQLSWPNPMKPGVKSRMKMLLEQPRQAMLQLHPSDRQFYCLIRCDLYQRFDGKWVWAKLGLGWVGVDWMWDGGCPLVSTPEINFHVDGSVQERCNSSVLVMELCLSYTNPSMWWYISRYFVRGDSSEM